VEDNFPLVTVCALSFNTGSYALEAIRSVLNTGYPNLEVICIDDGSTDGSAQLLENFASQLNFKLLLNLDNKGIATCCNLGLGMATGKYFLIIGDDLVLESRIIEDVKTLEEYPEAALVCSRVRIIDGEGRLIEKFANWTNGGREGPFVETPESIWLSGSRIFTPTATYRTEVLRELGGWDPEYIIEDKPIFMLFASKGIVGVFRGQISTYYRRHSQNFSAVFNPDNLRADVKLLGSYSLDIPNWRISLKFMMDVHFWYLFMKVDPKLLEAALEDIGLKKYCWTLRSRLLKILIYFVAASRPRGYFEVHPRFYLSKL